MGEAEAVGGSSRVACGLNRLVDLIPLPRALANVIAGLFLGAILISRLAELAVAGRGTARSTSRPFTTSTRAGSAPPDLGRGRRGRRSRSLPWAVERRLRPTRSR